MLKSNHLIIQKKVTINLDSSTYEEFQDYCEENDIIVSKRIERLIRRELEEQKKGVGK